MSEYIDTAAIAVNLLLEYGFKPREGVEHYWQIIENKYKNTN